MFRICIEKGFYIDIGANDPTLDSVTKAFYDRGWQGINIEPSPNFYKRLCAERPRDINLQVAVSDREGINRYFLAEEHMNLLGAFHMPPGFLDDFQFCYGHRFSYPIAELEAQLAYERKRADAAEAKLAIVKGDFSPLVLRLLQLPQKILKKLLA